MELIGNHSYSTAKLAMFRLLPYCKAGKYGMSMHMVDDVFLNVGWLHFMKWHTFRIVMYIKKTQTIRVHKAGVNEMSDMSNLKKLGGSAQKHIWVNSVYTSKAEPKS